MKPHWCRVWGYTAIHLVLSKIKITKTCRLLGMIFKKRIGPRWGKAPHNSSVHIPLFNCAEKNAKGCSPRLSSKTKKVGQVKKRRGIHKYLLSLLQRLIILKYFSTVYSFESEWVDESECYRTMRECFGIKQNKI